MSCHCLCSIIIITKRKHDKHRCALISNVIFINKKSKEMHWQQRAFGHPFSLKHWNTHSSSSPVVNTLLQKHVTTRMIAQQHNVVAPVHMLWSSPPSPVVCRPSFSIAVSFDTDIQECLFNVNWPKQKHKILRRRQQSEHDDFNLYDFSRTHIRHTQIVFCSLCLSNVFSLSNPIAVVSTYVFNTVFLLRF